MKSKLRVFTRRYEELIYKGRLDLSLPRRFRNRIWNVLVNYNERVSYYPNPDDNWIEHSDIIAVAASIMKDQYGTDSLMAFDDADNKVDSDLEGVVKRGYPSHVFDSLESAYFELSSNSKLQFQQDVNGVFEDESINWRMADGYIFKMDPSMLIGKITVKASELLKSHGFEGAIEEYKESLSDFTAEDYKGAIHNACKSMESVLKVILNCQSGNAAKLLKDLPDTGIFNDIPDSIAQSFGQSVFMALPFLRNRLGGHGQGDEVVSVSREYAELAIHIAGSFTHFLIQRYVKMTTGKKENVISQLAPDTDDLPF